MHSDSENERNAAEGRVDRRNQWIDVPRYYYHWILYGFACAANKRTVEIKTPLITLLLPSPVTLLAVVTLLLLGPQFESPSSSSCTPKGVLL